MKTFFFLNHETGDTFAERLFWFLMSCIKLDSATVTLLSIKYKKDTDRFKCRRNMYVTILAKIDRS